MDCRIHFHEMNGFPKMFNNGDKNLYSTQEERIFNRFWCTDWLIIIVQISTIFDNLSVSACTMKLSNKLFSSSNVTQMMAIDKPDLSIRIFRNREWRLRVPIFYLFFTWKFLNFSLILWWKAFGLTEIRVDPEWNSTMNTLCSNWWVLGTSVMWSFFGSCGCVTWFQSIFCSFLTFRDWENNRSNHFLAT